MGPLAPNKWAKYNPTARVEKRTNVAVAPEQPLGRRLRREYIPKYGSVAYHVLVGLRVFETENPGCEGIGQNELVRVMKRQASDLLVGGAGRSTPQIASALKTLTDNMCVYTQDTRIYLDTRGRALADRLLNAAGRPLEQSALVPLNNPNPMKTGEPSATPPAAPSATAAAGNATSAGSAANAQFSVEVWPSNDYKVRVILDTREVASQQDRQGIANDMRNAGLDVEIQALGVGDCLWVAEHKSGRWAVLDWIVERKTLGDLRLSVNDGRYHEQKARLAKSTLPNIVYLVEFAHNVYNNAMYKEHRRKFMTIMAHIAAAPGFRLKVTRSQNETVAYLATLTRCLERRYQDIELKVVIPQVASFQTGAARARANLGEIAIEYNAFHHGMSKSKMYTVGETFRLMLRTVRGLSHEKASTIQQLYPTPTHLLRAYQRQASEEDRRKLIANSTSNASRSGKVSVQLSELIYEIWKLSA